MLEKRSTLDENSLDSWRNLALKRDRQNIDQSATIARLETENAQFVALLREYREELPHDPCPHDCGDENCDRAKRIDAALAPDGADAK